MANQNVSFQRFFRRTSSWLIGVSLILGAPPKSPYAVAQQAEGSRLVKVVYGLHTTDDDKDHNTVVSVFLLCNEKQIGSDLGLDFGTRWSEGHNHLGEIHLDVYPDGGDLASCVLKITETADGNDRWHFDGKVLAIYAGGRSVEWNFHNGSLNSTGSKEVSQEFKLPHCEKSPCEA